MKNTYIVTIIIVLAVFSAAMIFHVVNLNKRNKETIINYETRDLKQKIDSMSRENEKTISDFKNDSEGSSKKSKKIIKTLKDEKIIVHDTTDHYMRQYIETYRPKY